MKVNKKIMALGPVRRKILHLLHYVNVPRLLCEHALGDDHGPKHRMIAGTVIMVVGVIISKGSILLHVEFIHFAGDVVGYLIHGVGAVPFVDVALRASRHHEDPHGDA